jgi:hypothetical protein
MRRLLFLIAALFASVTAAEARIVGAWECGEIGVELHKHMVHHLSLVFTGRLVAWSPTGKRVTAIKFEYVGRDGAILNGERCETLPYDPKWDEEDK